MGIFGNLFGSKKLETTDSDFGKIESFNVRGNNVGWTFKKQFLDSIVEVLIDGNKESISESQKRILIHALDKESQIKSESEKALKEQFDNADMEFVSIDKHFDVKSISIHDVGFELSFQEKSDPYYYFNVHFENNKQVGVSIDS